ncbi:MAG: Ig-like domain-containing protein, partial [Thermoplasmatota archaeon]
LDQRSVKQGNPVKLTGSVSDNAVVDSAYYSLDSPRNGRPLEFMNESWFSLEVSTAGLEPGVHELWIIAEDIYDNKAEESFPFEVLESEPPEIEIFSPEPRDLLKHGDPIMIEGRVRDNAAVTSLSISISGSKPQDIDIGRLDEQGYFTYTMTYSPSTVGEGYQELELTAGDGGGNTASEGFLVVLDGERPVITMDAPGPIVVPPTTDLEVTGKLTDKHTIGRLEVLVNGRSGHEARLSTVSGAFSIELRPSFDLFDGENTITFRGYDSVGWTTEEELVIVVDGAAPIVGFDGSPLFMTKGEELDVRVTIEDENDITGVFLITSGTGMVDITDELDVAEVLLSIDTTDLRTGMVDITVQARDAAGNIGEAAFSINIITDSLDSDGDGVPDWWEYKWDLDPFTFDSDKDPDGDGFTNLEEFLGDDGVWGEKDDSSNPRDFVSRPRTDSRGASIVLTILLVLGIVVLFVVLLVMGILMSRRRHFQETS